MKKVILSALVVCAFSFQAQAQKPELKLGAKVGLNVSSLSNDDDISAKAGLNIGFVAEYFVTEKFSIQPELLYSSQGGQYKNYEVNLEEFTIASKDVKFNLNYINIPIMAKYYVTNGFNIQAGPQVGFLTSAKFDGEDVKKNAQKVDFGVNFGLGYEFNAGVFFDARYNLGLSKVNKEKVEGLDNTKNGVFQVSVGYKF